ncbi:Sorting assembly machinery 35 kDa subunit [Frankliniella fusca]|uniref:Sorting assembly machinery 35 kDa subunit n=1 Tax=Frankliniella fusca TaxID=407009 RepID=A0AAE1LGA3_9NEOP|nr:Sorting assembly machinery 35 kDa subunit [Frankliniella fusca]
MEIAMIKKISDNPLKTVCRLESCALNVQDVSGVTLDIKGGAKEMWVQQSWKLGHAGVKPSTAPQEDPECILKNLRKKSLTSPCVEERQPVDPKMPSEKTTASRRGHQPCRGRRKTLIITRFKTTNSFQRIVTNF